MRIAVVGTGIAGMVAAHRLHPQHDVTVYEASARIGGHTNTVELEVEGRKLAIDTGFIVFNERTYPHFCALLKSLGVAWQASDMSFSVRCDGTGLEYNGTSLNGLLAQRSNALRPSFWRMVRDVGRFYREAPDVLEHGDDGETLGAFLERRRYSRPFVERHLLPMASAVWSARPDEMREFPLRFLVRFFYNHGFLQLDGRPQWLVVRGGSHAYVERLTAPFRERIRLGAPVVRVRRAPEGVRVRTAAGDEATYDRVVLAAHADQSLRMLADATPREREILGAFGWQRNEAVLHTDTRLMPRKRRAWASWNYHLSSPPSDLPTVTYWMNNLQGFGGPTQYLVTLNRADAIDPAKVLRSFVYHHPIYSPAAVRAQSRRGEIDGVAGVHFCGAYWGYGFHEDGVRSALDTVRRLGVGVAA